MTASRVGYLADMSKVPKVTDFSAENLSLFAAMILLCFGYLERTTARVSGAGKFMQVVTPMFGNWARELTKILMRTN